MIRAFESADLDALLAIWLRVNIAAHDFIDPQYWRDNAALVRSLLPQAAILVAEAEGGGIDGFIGVVDDSYIAGLFVVPDRQGTGIGGSLLARCQQQYGWLTLDVYRKNVRACRFYQRHGFTVQQEKVNAGSGETEYLMQWRR
ncbi:MAG: N-acetyltransferase [Sporomusaceae bacterium]|nr:N-acetyltransferase [Sporomusaceae bacterium]